MTERGLRDYLVLLSSYQTCRCKKVGFFKFLLSKQRDIDVFAAIEDPSWITAQCDFHFRLLARLPR